jgi:hypothetical protein
MMMKMHRMYQHNSIIQFILFQKDAPQNRFFQFLMNGIAGNHSKVPNVAFTAVVS